MKFNIQSKVVGDGHPLFFIAEAGVNHNGSLQMGKELIDIAIEARADAVKFQSFKTENIITPSAPKSTYHIETTGIDLKQSWYELLKTQEMSRDMHLELNSYCSKKDIIFMSTPYDEESADLLEELDIAAFKMASADTNNLPLMVHVAQKGRPMIISTAMATMNEIESTVSILRNEGLMDIAVLQCTGNYPSKLADSNLRVMNTFRKKLNCLVGYSDHTPGLINPIAATALGAHIYEKHFTIDKGLPGPDHRMSLNPRELKETIRAVREAEIALGSSQKKVLKNEKENRLKLRKSIVANTNIEKGQTLSKNILGIKRPANGLSPSEIKRVSGKKARCYIPLGTPITDEMIENDQ